MSSTALDTSPGPRVLTVYSQVMAWFLLGVVVFGVLGIEPVYQSVTPFYAHFLTASPYAVVPATVALVAILLYAGVCTALGLPLRGRGAYYKALAALTVYAVLAYAADVRLNNFLFQDYLLDLAYHVPVLLTVTVAAVVAALFLRNRPIGEHEWSDRTAWRVVFALAVFAFLFAGSVAMIRGGFDGIAAAYRRTGYEYIDDIGKGLTLLGFIRDYNELHPMLSMHAKVHPPGAVVMLWVMSTVLLSRDPLLLSIGTMAVGSFGVVPLYAWVRDMLGRRSALVAAAVYGVMPTIALFTATSADIMFLTLTIMTLFLFWRSVHRNSVWYAVAAGAGYAAMSLTSYSLLTVGAFFGFVGLWRMREAAMCVAVVKTAAIMVATFLLIHLAVRFGLGFDVIANFRLSHAQFIEDQQNLDQVSPRYPAWMFKFFNPLAILFFAGVPVSVLFVWRLVRPSSDGKALFVVFALTLLVLMPLYLARGEGERSAMYMMPFLLVPAAHMLTEFVQSARSYAPLAKTWLFLIVQTWLIETFLFTYW